MTSKAGDLESPITSPGGIRRAVRHPIDGWLGALRVPDARGRRTRTSHCHAAFGAGQNLNGCLCAAEVATNAG